VTRELLRRGNEVRVLDSLIEQVHGNSEQPEDFPTEAELVRGDIRNKDVVVRSLQGVDSVVHLAAEVGVGQSMYAVERYTSVNETGSAVLFEALIDKPVRRVVTASSMSIYGEGPLPRCRRQARPGCGARAAHVDSQSWDPLDAQGPARCARSPTPEWKRPDLASIYALGKYVQERQTLIMTQAYGMEGTCLRLFNVYGPGPGALQPLYRRAGDLLVAAAQRPAADDLRGRRAAAATSSMSTDCRPGVLRRSVPRRSGEVFNIGSGTPQRARGARRCAAMQRNDIEPEIVGKSGSATSAIAYCRRQQGRRPSSASGRMKTSAGLCLAIRMGCAAKCARPRRPGARRARGGGDLVGMSGRATAARS
jgi:dTDP-L-rhamnose 4-epimerase